MALTYDPRYYNPGAVYPYAPSAPQPPSNPAPASGNGIIFVQGEVGAKSYLVAPNTSVLLMDSEGQRFYIKSADASGIPQPIRTFEFKEVQAASTSPTESPVDMKNYVTREELEAKLREILDKGNEK